MANVRLILGPAGSGKTERCIAILRELETDESPAVVWAVVADRMQVRYFRRRVAEAGGLLGLSVGTFGEFYAEVMARARRFVPVAPPMVGRRLIRLAVRDALAAGAIRHCAAIADRAGFLAVAEEICRDMARESISADRLQAACAERFPMASELASIYRAYLRRLAQLGSADEESINGEAVALLERDPSTVSWLKGLVIDGFDSFEAHQLRSLAVLAQVVPCVVITLPGNGFVGQTCGTERKAHRRFRRALERLSEVVAAEIETCEVTHWKTPRLAQLEAGLFETAADPIGGDKRVQFLEVMSPAGEAREALRWLKARHLRDDVPLERCAIITASPETYQPLVRAAAAEFGIPVRCTLGQPLMGSPPISALMAFLRLPITDFSRRLLIDSVRSPFFDLGRFGLSRDDANALDAASRFGLVWQGLETWVEVLEGLARPKPSHVAEEGEEGLRAFLPVGEQARRLARGLRELGRFFAVAPRSQTAWVEWLEQQLQELGYGWPPQAGGHPDEQETDSRGAAERAAKLQLAEILHAMVLTAPLLGSERIGYAGFVAELEDLIETSGYEPSDASGLSAVSVLSLLEARGQRFSAVALLGLSEGLLPEIEREDPVLPDSIRAELGLEPRLDREQRGLFYLAVTRADDFLLLTRPYLTETGEEWAPSPFWGAALAASRTQRAEVRRVSSDTLLPLADAASTGELVFWAVRQHAKPPADVEQSENWQFVSHGAQVLAARLARRPAGPFEGSLVDLGPRLSARYGPEHVWSASRLETYASCPLSFLAQVVLGLEPFEPPTIGMDAAQLGTLFHRILELTFRTAADPSDVASLLAALRSAAEQVFGRAPEELGFRPTPWWAAEKEALLSDLEATVRALAQEAEDWRPVALEQSFGVDGPPLTIQCDGQTIRLRGIIDRVDRDRDGNIRVIDYKAGSRHLAASDLVQGVRLQLPLYALAARQVLRLGEPVDGFYWAVRQAQAGPLKLRQFHHETEEGTFEGAAGAIELACRHVAHIATSVRAGMFAPRPPAGGCPEYCAAVPWCWRYQPGW